MIRATPLLRRTGLGLSLTLFLLPTPIAGLQAHPNSAPD